jgi:hypothetical protein
MRLNLPYPRLRLLIEQANPRPRGRRDTHGDADVAAAYLWAEMHGQPTYWACSRKAYPPGCRFTPPSASTLSRRLRKVPVRELLARVRLALLDADDAPPVLPLKVVDAKPLAVGNSSGDRDARRGKAGGGGRGPNGRGYKLCVLVSNGLVRTWTLSGLNENDQVLAAGLIPRLPAVAGEGGWGYVVADNGFDGNPLYVAAAGRQHLWVAPPRAGNRGVRDARRNSPERTRSLDHSDSPLWHACGQRRTMGRQLMRDRGGIERLLGHATLLGLGPLPPWVRTPHRVAMHVEAQLIFHTLRVLESHRQRRQAQPGPRQDPPPPLKLPPPRPLLFLPAPTQLDS